MTIDIHPMNTSYHITLCLGVGASCQVTRGGNGLGLEANANAVLFTFRVAVS